jgi:ferritin-like metal-binding protein YciE
MKIDTLKKLYVHELKDLYSAENQILDALPKMIEAAADDDLRNAFETHRKETEDQVRRLEKIFRGLEFEPGGHKCSGMEGLLEEGDEVIKEIDVPEVRDAAMVGAAQRVEHYEMAGYGTARALAEQLGEHEAADLLAETLEEEGEADRILTRLAERSLNLQAMA